MLVLNAHGYNLVGSEPIFVANKSGKIPAPALSKATNRTQIGSELAKNRHFKIVPEPWITLYMCPSIIVGIIFQSKCAMYVPTELLMSMHFLLPYSNFCTWQ